MEGLISAIVNEIGIATFDEIESILKICSREIKRKTLHLKLKELERKGIIFKIFPDENFHNLGGYILGVGDEFCDEDEIKEVVRHLGIPSRTLEHVKWKSFSERILKTLVEDIRKLNEILESSYNTIENIELKYFDLSIKYHEIFGFLFEKYENDVLNQVEILLNELRENINKKEN